MHYLFFFYRSMLLAVKTTPTVFVARFFIYQKSMLFNFSYRLTVGQL